MKRNAPAHGSSSSTKSPKRTIDTTATPDAKNFFLMCITFVFKKFVFAPTHIKIGLYICTLILGSFLKDFNVINQKAYFASKHNLFNAYFVKFGWAWTLVVCVPFVFMTSVVYTGFNKIYVRNNLARLLVATIIWFVFTKLFDMIDAKTGVCMVATLKSKYECKSNKHEWINGFDISGHTFILMHALFLMLEEVKVFNKWDELRKKLNEIARRDEFTPSTERAFYWFNILTPYIKINFFLMACLALLWEIMLLSTFLYFHTILHKLLAAFFAIILWFITYKCWYNDKNLFMSPGLPGNGIEKISL